MTAYAKKKPHIYAYRRRNSADKHIERLKGIVEKSNVKDVERLMKKVNELWWNMEEKVGVFDQIPKRGERWETAFDKKVREGEAEFGKAVAQYVCPNCRKPGYLYIPDMDLKGRQADRYILHISFREEACTLCQISSVKTHLIMISSVPSEGILTLQ